jgi:hypothetical protein
MEVFRPVDLANVAIEGMTQKSVDIMSAGKPWGHDELFLSFHDLLQAEYCNGVYNVRILQADPDQLLDELTDRLLIKIHNYGGSNSAFTDKMIVKRCLQHFLPAIWQSQPSSKLYQLMQEPNTRAEAKVVSVISPELVSAYGSTPIKLIEACFLDLMGCWQLEHSIAHDQTKNLWKTRPGDEITLLPEAWVTRFKAYADPSAKTTRDIIKSALQSHGLNLASPVFEEHAHRDHLCLQLVDGGVTFLREHHGDCFENRLAPTYLLKVPSEQKKEILAMGYKISSKSRYDGTPVMIQIHVTDKDDDRNWANLKVAKPEYEIARRILLTLAWTSTTTGEEVKYYLKNTRGSTGRGVTVTDVVRARESMTLLEYANGTLTLNKETPPNRLDFACKERNKAKVLDDRLIRGVACPGPNCDFKHRTTKTKDLHFQANESCKAAYKALTDAEKKEFQFIICWNCGYTCSTVTKMSGHIFGAALAKQNMKGNRACAAHFRSRFGRDAKVTSENSNRFM